ncbi:MAG: hypothetical protein HC875_26645 [Anaerolineales bacterium]|nr:hypothetical protein [Anaerolineales bacterium]
MCSLIRIPYLTAGWRAGSKSSDTWATITATAVFLFAALADYELARRMEMEGPTVYLPEVITMPLPNLWRTVLIGQIMPALFRLGVPPPPGDLPRLIASVGPV